MQEIKLLAPWQMAEMKKSTPVLLALSGGADSRLLLHLLAEMARRDGFLLLAAHVNHGIRGEEALRDRAFCVSLAKSYGVELCILDADVPALAKEHGRGLEEEARAVRYGYFAALMRERGIPLLVTAHNADDHAETVLFRMARGSGLAGLCGIRPIRPFEGGMLVRPLLGTTKREVLAYCAREGLQFVTDSTNADTAYARNKLRAEVLPVLETLFPGASVRMGEMSAGLAEDEAVLSEMARRFLATHCTGDICPIAPLMEQPKPIIVRILLYWLRDRFGVDAERAHLDAVMSLARAGVAHSAVSLPSGVTLTLENGALCRSVGDGGEVAAYRIPLRVGETELPCGGQICVKKVEKNLKVHNLSIAPYIILKDVSAIMKNGAYWRPREAGDRILRGGMHREVRRLYREAGLPLSVRQRLPVLCDGEGILWVPYVGARDGVESAEVGDLVEVRLTDENGNLARSSFRAEK